MYDANGDPFGFTYNGATYYYLKNLQNDVIAIADSKAYVIANYYYDDWGNLVEVTGNTAIAELNPIRYRSYYFDSESGWYYLNSRYYSPEMCRFLNADGYVQTGQGMLDKNMFAYCGNDPINRADPSGGFWVAVAVAGTAVSAAVAGYKYLMNRNYTNNSAVDKNPATTTENKLINDQNKATGDNFDYGCHPASHNGCEAIAVHNAKILKRKESTLSDTMKDFQQCGAMIGDGYFGSSPHMIGLVLHKSGISYSRVGRKELTNPGVYIVSYWNKGAPWNGLHTVAIEYDGNAYTTYNLSGYGSPSTRAPSEYAGNRYICGYYLG